MSSRIANNYIKASKTYSSVQQLAVVVIPKNMNKTVTQKLGKSYMKVVFAIKQY